MNSSIYQKTNQKLELLTEYLHVFIMKIMAPFFTLLPVIVSILKYASSENAKRSFQQIYPASYDILFELFFSAVVNLFKFQISLWLANPNWLRSVYFHWNFDNFSGCRAVWLRVNFFYWILSLFNRFYIGSRSKSTSFEPRSSFDRTNNIHSERTNQNENGPPRRYAISYRDKRVEFAFLL